MVTLLCTVRGCHRPLVCRERQVVCSRGHSFDIARSGYINLLQAQDRRAPRPGDTREALAARRRLRARGVGAALLDAVGGLLPLRPTDAVLDVGCGDGDHLAAIAERCACQGHGVDIAVPAVAAAASRYPRLHWVVANADRFLPYAAASFGAVVSITARMNSTEFRRVLHDDGTLLIAVPGPDDLIELRAAVLGQGALRDRVERTAAVFAPLFSLERHRRVRQAVHLDAAAMRDAMTSSYRAVRRPQRARLAEMTEGAVTFSHDVLVFRPRREGGVRTPR